MILFIDTSSVDTMTVSLLSKTRLIVTKTVTARYRQIEKLLPLIEQLMRQKKIKLRQLKGIAVVSGPGSFSALRSGVAAANALGFAWQKSVVGVPLEAAEDPRRLMAFTQQRLEARRQPRLVLPAYGQAPTISKKKLSLSMV